MPWRQGRVLDDVACHWQDGLGHFGHVQESRDERVDGAIRGESGQDVPVDVLPLCLGKGETRGIWESVAGTLQLHGRCSWACDPVDVQEALRRLWPDDS